MSNQDFELLSAYLDGELDAAAVRALEQRLPREPLLASKLLQLRELQASLQLAFGDSADGARVPVRIRELLQPQPERILPLPHRHKRWSTGLRSSVAIAASLILALGLVLAPQWQQQRHPAADTLLSAALETTPSRAAGWDQLADGRQLRGLLSFPSRDGSWCREYLLASDARTVHGVACRDGGHWEPRVTVEEAAMDNGESVYRTASANDSDPIADFIAAEASDVAAGAEKESGLIANHWQ
ncbi:anti-sigma factor family protein [Kineobactrum salinum]|uniref:Anti-sigma factor n=1 Tax=Kineobactrum salinum TaxID=2708301 RepID=A0A6C0U2I9_9GAMM|nr:hypothetical protein [Kineobactrum salinum]QIB64585.1 hypothetical protein G3T16_03415 [Kineobactrum salinum]